MYKYVYNRGRLGMTIGPEKTDNLAKFWANK